MLRSRVSLALVLLSIQVPSLEAKVVRRADRDRMLRTRDALLALALVFAWAEPMAGQWRSNLATVQLYAVSSPGARLEPLAASESGAKSGLPFGLAVNRPYRLQVRWAAPPPAGQTQGMPAPIGSATSVNHDRSADPRVIWTAEGLPGAVPLGAIRDSLTAAGFGGAEPSAIVEVVVVPLP